MGAKALGSGGTDEGPVAGEAHGGLAGIEAREFGSEGIADQSRRGERRTGIEFLDARVVALLGGRRSRGDVVRDSEV